MSIPNTSLLQLILKKSLNLEDEERCKGQGILTIAFAPEELEKIQKTITLWRELLDVQTQEHQELKDRYNTCKMSMKLKDNEIEELEEYKEKYYNCRYNHDEEWEFVADSIKKEVVENDDGFKEVVFSFNMHPYTYGVKYIITPKKYYFATTSGNFDDNGHQIWSRKEVKNIYQSKCGDYLAHNITAEDEETLLEYEYLID